MVKGGSSERVNYSDLGPFKASRKWDNQPLKWSVWLDRKHVLALKGQEDKGAHEMPTRSPAPRGVTCVDIKLEGFPTQVVLLLVWLCFGLDQNHYVRNIEKGLKEYLYATFKLNPPPPPRNEKTTSIDALSSTRTYLISDSILMLNHSLLVS